MRFRKITETTRTTEQPGSSKIRRLLLAGGILSACAILAVGAFALRGLERDGFGPQGQAAASVDGAGNGPNLREAIGERDGLDRTEGGGETAVRNTSPLSLTDLEALAEVEKPADGPAKESGDSGELEVLHASGNFWTGRHWDNGASCSSYTAGGFYNYGRDYNAGVKKTITFHAPTMYATLNDNIADQFVIWRPVIVFWNRYAGNWMQKFGNPQWATAYDSQPAQFWGDNMLEADVNGQPTYAGIEFSFVRDWNYATQSGWFADVSIHWLGSC